MVRGMALAPAARAVALPSPPIRIRTLLVAGLSLWGVCSLAPRALAGYRVHTLAAAVADYAVCMVGPTGPALLRDNQSEFHKLVRRRLVAAGPSEHPFERCGKQAREITGSAEIAKAHELPAASFVEYGLDGVQTAAVLAVTSEPLVNAARGAWPFVRGYTALVKPSLGAFEAIHPIGLPRPAVGRGIPAWRAQYRAVKPSADGFVLAFGRGAHLSLHKTSDAGVTWRPASTPSADFAERCWAADGKSYELALGGDRNVMELRSIAADGSAHATDLAPESNTVYATACDERAFVALLRPENSRTTSMLLCPFEGRCTPLAPPKAEQLPGLLDHTLDVARVRGTTVLAATTHGVVRVTSSRDDGRSWTPPYVAYDDAEQAGPRVDVAVPSRLLTIEGRVLLYGGSNKPSQTYSVLISDDHGASFRTP